MKLIAGLGNPGKKYEHTRHNAGFDILDKLAEDASIDITKKKLGAVFGSGFIETERVILVKPLLFMNLSGGPVRDIIKYFDINPDNLIVIHDDLDLELGRIQIKENGKHGGHNGLKSIINSLKTDNFLRIRFGIGRPDKDGKDRIVTDYVLTKYADSEKKKTKESIKRAADAVISVISEGPVSAMNYFNRKDFLI